MKMRTTTGFCFAVLIISACAWTKQAHAHHHSADSPKHDKSASTHGQVRRDEGRSRKSPIAVHRERQKPPQKAAAARLPRQDEYIRPIRVVGPREVGTAAWYGAGRLGARTASGERLDGIHCTAAHRSLPLNSLVRVTNLRNGRSTIAKINDRGPVSRSLLIDLSPRTADELDMKRAGLARVSIEPVVEEAAARQ